MRGSPRDARNYELMTVISPDVSEEDLQGTIDRVVGYVTTAGGAVADVSRDSPWGRRRLSYPIRHSGRDVRDGFYTLYHFEIAPHRVEDVERELKLNDRIMRYLLTQHTPPPAPAPAAAPAGDGQVETAAIEETAVVAPVAEAVSPQATDAEESLSPAPADDADTEEASPSEEE